MCLHTVDKKPKKVTEGWKVFVVNKKEIYSVYNIFKFKTNKWIEDDCCYHIFSSNIDNYITGFHFFFNKNDAKYLRDNKKTRKILKVKVRDITATGYQNNLKVGVARKIFIEEE